MNKRPIIKVQLSVKLLIMSLKRMTPTAPRNNGGGFYLFAEFAHRKWQCPLYLKETLPQEVFSDRGEGVDDPDLFCQELNRVGNIRRDSI